METRMMLLGVGVVAVVGLIVYALISLKKHLLLQYDYEIFAKKRLFWLGVALLIFIIAPIAIVSNTSFNEEAYVQRQLRKVNQANNVRVDEIITKEHEKRLSGVANKLFKTLPSTDEILNNQSLREQYAKQYLASYDVAYEVPQKVIEATKMEAKEEAKKEKAKASENTKGMLLFVLGMFVCFSVIYLVRTVMNVGFVLAIPTMLLQYVAALLFVTIVGIVVYLIACFISDRNRRE